MGFLTLGINKLHVFSDRGSIRRSRKSIRILLRIGPFYIIRNRSNGAEPIALFVCIFERINADIQGYTPSELSAQAEQPYTGSQANLWNNLRSVSLGISPEDIQRGRIRYGSERRRFHSFNDRYMKENEIEQCVRAVKMYIQEEQPYGINYLEQHRIAEEELRSSSPIRLMILVE